MGTGREAIVRRGVRFVFGLVSPDERRAFSFGRSGRTGASEVGEFQYTLAGTWGLGKLTMNRTQEQKLVRRAAAGDRASAELLIQTYQRSVYAFILRLSGRPEVAEDVVQEAFVRVLTHLDRFNPEYRFSTWLFTIARRVYLNWCERKKARSGAEEAIQAIRVDSDGVCLHEVEADEREFRTTTRVRLEDALQRLTVEQREVVVLFHQHEWPLWLIAEQLDIPLGTVKSHLHRGRMRLRELMTAPIAVPAVEKLGEKSTQELQTRGEVGGMTLSVRRSPREVGS